MKALSVKYRPETFEEICGQSSIVKILERQLATNRIKNCYLFCGPSGTGKTTIGRALAKRINSNKGKPIEIKPYERNKATRIIEDFMLIANETIAQNFFWQEVPFVYRTHENPDPEKIIKLGIFIKRENAYWVGH